MVLNLSFGSSAVVFVQVWVMNGLPEPLVIVLTSAVGLSVLCRCCQWWNPLLPLQVESLQVSWELRHIVYLYIINTQHIIR